MHVPVYTYTEHTHTHTHTHLYARTGGVEKELAVLAAVLLHVLHIDGGKTLANGPSGLVSGEDACVCVCVCVCVWWVIIYLLAMRTMMEEEGGE